MHRYQSLSTLLVCAALTPLSACSGHQSFSAKPSSSSYLPPQAAKPQTRARKLPAEVPTPAFTSSAAQRSIRIANIETGEELIASAGRAVAVLNGSRLRFSIADSRITSGTVRAFDASAALVRGAAGEWTASLRYVDSSNPPSPDPALQITLQTDRGPQTLRLPVTELHQ